jgi:hypothetical protein
MHVIVTLTETGIAAAVTGRDHPDGMLMNFYVADAWKDTLGGRTILFWIGKTNVTVTLTRHWLSSVIVGRGRSNEISVDTYPATARKNSYGDAEITFEICDCDPDDR